MGDRMPETERNRMSELMAWYREAQNNVVAWLEGGPDDDTLDNNIAQAMQRRFAMWCLARNLRDAGGCAEARRQLYRALFSSADSWEPNLDGKPAPGWER